MRIAIIGAGGLGSKLGALLAEEAEVWMVHHRSEYVDAIRQHGIRLISGTEEKVVRVNVTIDPSEIGVVDVVFVLVKSYDTGKIVDSIVPIVGQKTLVVTLQNGLGNLELLRARFGADNTVLGVTFHGATLERPGVTHDKGYGATYIAKVESRKHEIRKLVELLNACGVATETTNDVTSMLWTKLCVTSGINPVATVLQVVNGVLGENPSARQLSMDAIFETMAVAEAKGIALAFDPIERFEAVVKATAHMYSGTLIDSLRGRTTEIDAISGAIANEGNTIGVLTPLHYSMWRIIKAREATYDARVSATDLSSG